MNATVITEINPISKASADSPAHIVKIIIWSMIIAKGVSSKVAIAARDRIAFLQFNLYVVSTL